MDNDDEVMHESDVYITRNASPYILLFPSKESPLNDAPSKIRMRQNTDIFEIESAIDTKSKNYDRHKSEQIAYAADNIHSDKEKDKEIHFPDKVMNRSVMISEVRPSVAQYAIAMIRNNSSEVHLTPIKSVIKFKSSLRYFDKSDIHIKAKNSVKDDSEMSSQDEAEPIEEVKAITMKFASNDDERIQKLKERSFKYMNQQIINHPWIEMEYNTFDDDQSERSSLMFNSNSSVASNSNSQSSINSLEEYFQNIRTFQCIDPSSNNSQNSKGDSVSSKNSPSLLPLSLTHIKTLPLTEQVRALLSNAKLLSFDQINELLSEKFDSTAVLRIVQMFAYLIQGNWIVKSDILYTNESFSPLTGVSGEILCRTRDFIICLFSQSLSLSVEEINKKFSIPREDLLNILSQLSVYDPSMKCWNFSLPTDNVFIERNPDIVQRQKLLLQSRFSTLERYYQTARLPSEDANQEKTNSYAHSPRRRRHSSRSSTRRNSTASISADENEICISDEIISDNANDISVNTVIKSKTEQISKSTPSVRKFLMPNGVNEKRVNQKKGTKMALLEISPTLGPYPTPEERRELVRIIQDRLKNYFCMTIYDLKKVIYEKFPNKYSWDNSEELIESFVIEAGGFKVQNKWPQNSMKQTVFAYTKFGDSLDSLRDTLIEMFSDQTRIRITNFKAKVRDNFGEKNCENNCRKLLKDYCVLKSSLYYLKGTVDSS